MADTDSLPEANVHGFLTGFANDLVKAMGAGGMSKSHVSCLWPEIDERVDGSLGYDWDIMTNKVRLPVDLA